MALGPAYKTVAGFTWPAVDKRCDELVSYAPQEITVNSSTCRLGHCLPPRGRKPGGRQSKIDRAQGRLRARGSAAVCGIKVLLGFWTIVSPWGTGYVANKPALANDLMFGVFVMALGIWSARATEAKHGHALAL